MLIKFIVIFLISLIIVWEIIHQLTSNSKQIQTYDPSKEILLYETKILTLEKDYQSKELSEEEYLSLKSDLNDKINAIKRT